MSEVRSTTTLEAATAADGISPSGGARGASAARDHSAIEGLARRYRASIPERVVHAKGCGARGTLTITRDLSHLTRARVFSAVGKKTELLIRFSTFAGEAGAADAERDPRGFAIRFHTEDGDWDIVGGNAPVYFIRDPAKLAALVDAQKRDPRTNLRSPTAMWDFWSRSPESLHRITFLFSDRGLPVAPQYMNGHGVHAFSFLNGIGERRFVKFHFETLQGHRHYTDAEAADIVGQSRESSQEELSGSIAAGRLPRWTLAVQVVREENLDPFDPTRVWPHAVAPLVEVGVVELNRNVENHAAEIERAAFSPANLVPGIGLSPDPILRARLDVYADAQRHRLGDDYATFAVNLAIGAAAPDRTMAVDDPVPCDAAPWRTGVGGLDDDLAQPRALYALFDAGERARLHANIAASLVGVPEAIVERLLALFAAVHPDYAAGVRAAMRIG
ncbi:MAG: catalase [Siculibacillus sp.]|nr:catalase [Siculibacillus sp.]